MFVRLIPQVGGDGSFLPITVMNDTGSNALTLFTTDFQHLGNAEAYNGWVAASPIIDANGHSTTLPTLLVEVHLAGNDGNPWGRWVTERAIVREPNPSIKRLSGAGIRRTYFIGTGPSNDIVGVSTTSAGLSSLLH